MWLHVVGKGESGAQILSEEWGLLDSSNQSLINGTLEGLSLSQSVGLSLLLSLSKGLILEESLLSSNSVNGSSGEESIGQLGSINSGDINLG